MDINTFYFSVDKGSYAHTLGYSQLASEPTNKAKHGVRLKVRKMGNETENENEPKAKKSPPFAGTLAAAVAVQN